MKKAIKKISTQTPAPKNKSHALKPDKKSPLPILSYDPDQDEGELIQTTPAPKNKSHALKPDKKSPLPILSYDPDQDEGELIQTTPAPKNKPDPKTQSILQKIQTATEVTVTAAQKAVVELDRLIHTNESTTAFKNSTQQKKTTLKAAEQVKKAVSNLKNIAIKLNRHNKMEPDGGEKIIDDIVEMARTEADIALSYVEAIEEITDFDKSSQSFVPPPPVQQESVRPHSDSHTPQTTATITPEESVALAKDTIQKIESLNDSSQAFLCDNNALTSHLDEEHKMKWNPGCEVLAEKPFAGRQAGHSVRPMPGFVESKNSIPSPFPAT